MRTTWQSYLLDRAENGPWVEAVRAGRPIEPTGALRDANVDLVASAPLFSADVLVGLLSIGSVVDDRRSKRSQQARLLAAAIDYAAVLTAVAGRSLGGRLEVGKERARLQGILDRHEFHPVFQPVVDVETQAIVGFEALTRFDDGTRPDVRFAEAGRVDLGPTFELEAVRLAIADSDRLPSGAFISVNLSPSSLIERSDEVRRISTGAPGR